MSKACRPGMPIENEYNKSLPVQVCPSTLVLSFLWTLVLLDVKRLDNPIYGVNHFIHWIAQYHLPTFIHWRTSFFRGFSVFATLIYLEESKLQPRSQGISSYRPLERWETLGTMLSKLLQSAKPHRDPGSVLWRLRLFAYPSLPPSSSSSIWGWTVGTF